MAQSKIELTKEQREAIADCYRIIMKAARRHQQQEENKKNGGRVNG